MAASVLRRLGFKKHEPRESEARQKLQRELFSFNRCVEHGFPHKPTALAYDSKLKLLAIGTKTGALRIVGRPGVEYSGQLDEDIEISKLFFLPEQARVLTLCSDNSLHLWEINTRDGEAVLEDKRQVKMDASKVKSVTSCCLTGSADQLLLGTESGNIHSVSVPDLTLSDSVIYLDNVMQNVPDDLKANPGPVETIAQHPSKPEKFLVGYNRGLVVLWDNTEKTAEKTFNSSQLESVAWHRDGTQFMTSHADGSYIVWSTLDSTKPKEQASTPYGPFPCKAINKIQWKTAKSEPFVLFSGGMPRASYGDRHTVTAVQGDTNHVVFDFASKVIDFVTICSAEELEDYDKFEYDDPHSMLVLTEEEIVAIDLKTEGWPVFALPYMNSLHSSAITCTAHVNSVPDAFWAKILDAGESQHSQYSSRDWPITGGQTLPQNLGAKNLLLTGHEDGCVRFWDVSTTSQKLMYTLKTAAIFGCDMGPLDGGDEDEGWPPFKKVGTFDPYSDDPRLGIQKLTLCPLSETLVLSGTAGQTCVMQWEREERTQEVKVTQVNIVTDQDGFVWKGHEALPVKGGETKFSPGFQPVCVMQLHPPAAATAQALHSEWQMLAVGTAHGFAIFDYSQRVEVASMCTLDPTDLSGAAESGPMSRAKTFKKSLRESFRRLRKRRADGTESPKTKSPKASPKKSKPESPAKKSEGGEQQPQGASSIEAPAGEETTTEGGAAAATTPVAEGGEGAAPATAAGTAGATAAPAEEPAAAPKVEVIETGDTSTKPVEREITARKERSANEEMASMVRALYFADTFLMNSSTHGPTVWAGTNGGHIYAYTATLPDNDKRDAEPVKCVLGKEIKLQHKAPVMSMTVIDRHAAPLTSALEVQHERAKAANMTGGHQLVVVSEEQFKIFSLPSLKASTKYKLTAHEGSKIRRVGFVNFRSKSDERYQENDLAILTNQGDVQVWSVPHLRRQLKAPCVRKENVSGIVSSLFTQCGEGFFLASPSEFVRFSLSARFVPKAACEVLLKDGVRPALPEPEAEKPEEPAAAAEEVEVKATAEETPAAAAEGEAGAESAPAEAAAAEKETTPKPEESKPEEEGAGDTSLNVTSPADESNIADTTGEITLDSVRIHLNDSNVTESRESKVEVVESNQSSSTMTVTKTVVRETIEGGQVTSHQETTTTTTTEVVPPSGGGDESGVTEGVASAVTASGANLDDDSKLTNHGEETESRSTGDELEQLYISEEGDESHHSNAQQLPSNQTTTPSNQAQLPSNLGNMISNEAHLHSNQGTMPSNEAHLPSNQSTVLSDDSQIPSNQTSVSNNQVTMLSSEAQLHSNQNELPDSQNSANANIVTDKQPKDIVGIESSPQQELILDEVAKIVEPNDPKEKLYAPIIEDGIVAEIAERELADMSGNEIVVDKIDKVIESKNDSNEKLDAPVVEDGIVAEVAKKDNTELPFEERKIKLENEQNENIESSRIENEAENKEPSDQSRALMQIEEFTAPSLIIDQNQQPESLEKGNAPQQDGEPDEECAPFEIETPPVERQTSENTRCVAMNDVIGNLQDIAARHGINVDFEDSVENSTSENLTAKISTESRVQQGTDTEEKAQNEVGGTPKYLVENEAERSGVNGATEMSEVTAENAVEPERSNEVDQRSNEEEQSSNEGVEQQQLRPSSVEILCDDVITDKTEMLKREVTLDECLKQLSPDDEETPPPPPPATNQIADIESHIEMVAGNLVSEVLHSVLNPQCGEAQDSGICEENGESVADYFDECGQVEVEKKVEITEDGDFSIDVTAKAEFLPNTDQSASKENTTAQSAESEMTVAGIEPKTSTAEEIARYDASDEEYEYIEVIEEVEVTDDDEENGAQISSASGLTESRDEGQSADAPVTVETADVSKVDQSAGVSKMAQSADVSESGQSTEVAENLQERVDTTVTEVAWISDVTDTQPADINDNIAAIPTTGAETNVESGDEKSILASEVVRCDDKSQCSSVPENTADESSEFSPVSKQPQDHHPMNPESSTVSSNEMQRNEDTQNDDVTMGSHVNGSAVKSTENVGVNGVASEEHLDSEQKVPSIEVVQY